LLVFCVAGGLYAQNTGFSAAAGGGINGYTTSGITGGPGLNVLYGLSDRFHAGLSTGLSFAERVTTWELNAAIRMFFFEDADSGVSPFAEAGAGISLLSLHLTDATHKVNRAALLPLFQASLGVRIPLFGSFYIEPSVRGGYPFLLGLSIMIGTKMPPVFTDDAAYDDSNFDDYYNDTDYNDTEYDDTEYESATSDGSEPASGGSGATGTPSNNAPSNGAPYNGDEERYETLN
jgi:hypothetical protein